MGWLHLLDSKTLYNSSDVAYKFFHHSEGVDDVPNSTASLQQALDNTRLLVGHNIKFDLQWLWETGFNYAGAVYDTMLGEYLLARGQKLDLSLRGSCIRRNTERRKSDITQELWEDGLTYFEIPKPLVIEYGIDDILATADLYHTQQKLYKEEENAGLIPTLDMCNEFLL